MNVLFAVRDMNGSSTQTLFINKEKSITMCDPEDCGIELKEPTPNIQQTVNKDESESDILERRFMAYFKHSITQPLGVHRIVIDLTSGCEEKDQPMYLLLTDATVIVCRNFDVIIRDLRPAKEVFDLLNYLEEQMMNRDLDKPVVEGYQ